MSTILDTSVVMFFEHAWDVLQEGEKPGLESLEDLIIHWVNEGIDGGGIKDCAEDFQFFQSVVILIISQWHEDFVSDKPDDELSIPRRISQIFSRNVPRQILDPYWFKWSVVNPMYATPRTNRTT